MQFCAIGIIVFILDPEVSGLAMKPLNMSLRGTKQSHPEFLQSNLFIFLSTDCFIVFSYITKCIVLN